MSFSTAVASVEVLVLDSACPSCVAVGACEPMEYGLPHLALDDFDPMSVLIEDAVHFEGPELVYDYIDALMTLSRIHI